MLVIGDVMLDKYTYGTVDRISPEAPIPVVTKTSEKYLPGGSSNVANNLVSLGAKVYLCGAIGDDESGKILTEKLKEQGIDTSLLFVNSDQETTVKHRIVVKNQQMLRIDHESLTSLSLKMEKQIINKLARVIPVCDAIILSDYAKGFFSSSLAKKIIALAKKHKRKILADIKPKNRTFFRFVDVVTPNLKEAREMSGKGDVTKAGLALSKYFQAEILLTQAEMGMSIFLQDGTNVYIPTKRIEVSDVTGAGDTVIAVASLFLISGLSLYDSAVLANFAASLVVQKSGVATVSVEELSTVLQEERHIETVAIVPKLWGYEKWVENNDKYCSKILAINKGYQCSLHYHKIKDEMFLLIKGHVRLELGDEIIYLRPGSFQRVPPHTNHRFRGLEYSEIVEISTHHDDGDSYRIEESRKV